MLQCEWDMRAIAAKLLLCSTEWRKSNEFQTTRGWVNDDRVFIFGWTIPIKYDADEKKKLSQISYLYASWVSGWQIRSAYSLGCISQVLRLGKRSRVCLYYHLENNVHVLCQFMKNECSSQNVMFLDGARWETNEHRNSFHMVVNRPAWLSLKETDDLHFKVGRRYYKSL